MLRNRSFGDIGASKHGRSWRQAGREGKRPPKIFSWIGS